MYFMKVNMMNESGVVKHDLAEDKLQSITGGCATCTYFSKQSGTYIGVGQGHRKSAEAALAAGNRSEAQKYVNLAKKALASAEKYQHRLKMKMAEHG
jgi:hypothetical protein